MNVNIGYMYVSKLQSTRRLSLSRLQLPRITAYLGEKIWSLFKD